MASDWAREGLLDGLEESARKRRVRLLDELESAGCGREEIRRAAADERLSLLLVDRTLGGQPEYDARTLAERSGAELDFLVRVQQAMGRAVPDLDEPAFDQGDLEAAELLAQLRAAGIEEEGLLEVTRVLGRALNQGADAIRGVFERAFVEAGVPEDQFAQRNARLAKGLLDLTGPLLTYVLTVHLREGIRAEAVGEAGRAASGELAGARAVGVAFVDLVGYTRLGEQVEADEVGAVAQRLEALSTEVAVAPVRVVKTIGDAVMLVAPDATRLLGTVLELVDRVAAEGDDYPEAHAGVAFGPALARGGDWYGHPVNLASRITAIARPRSVLCADAMREVAGEERFRWSSAGSRQLKGLRRPERLLRARRREDGEDGSG